MTRQNAASPRPQLCGVERRRPEAGLGSFPILHDRPWAPERPFWPSGITGVVGLVMA